MSRSAAGAELLGPDLGPSVETDIVRDLLRRGVLAAPLLIAACGLGWGVDGAVSAALGFALAAANLALAAVLQSTAARISIAVVMAAALGGYVGRLLLLLLVVVAVKDQAWLEKVPLSIALLTSHLGLLIWEVRHVSASLAYPGLKPKAKKG